MRHVPTGRAPWALGPRALEPDTMTPTELRDSLRRVDVAGYPELSTRSRDEIYGHGDQLSPGGLFLATEMARRLRLREGGRVLDVGCGFGESSMFLAETFGVDVVAVDLWVPPTTLARRIEARGLATRVTPLQLDVTKPLPFADNYFDAIFSMTTFHHFADDDGVAPRLLRTLKSGGRAAISDTCFNEEIAAAEVPPVFKVTPAGNIFDTWTAETSTYHSPGWWRRRFEQVGCGRITECDELEIGPAMWEDKLAYDLERASWDANKIDQMRWKIDQILYGRAQSPYFTFFLATLEKP